MATANLNKPTVEVINSNDNIVIIDNFQSIRGGRTLDVTGYPHDTIKAGHVIIQETTTGEYKPMPLASGNATYGTLPTGHTYAGILIASILTSLPLAGIMVRGTVNTAVTPFPMSTILTAVKTALPLIIFTTD